MELTHLDDRGEARMVDVGGKGNTFREAVARGKITMRPETLQIVLKGKGPKGEVFGVAKVAGIMAAKKTAGLIPLCHPLLLTAVEVFFAPDEENSSVEIEARVRTIGPTGVEMEALTAVSAAALTIYDMCKAVDREMVIGAIRLSYKTGGRSGTFLEGGDI